VPSALLVLLHSTSLWARLTVVDLIARVMAEEDEETAKGICQVLIRLGESFTHQLFAHDEIGRPFVEFALACMSHESREV